MSLESNSPRDENESRRDLGYTVHPEICPECEEQSMMRCGEVTRCFSTYCNG